MFRGNLDEKKVLGGSGGVQAIEDLAIGARYTGRSGCPRVKGWQLKTEKVLID